MNDISTIFQCEDCLRYFQVSEVCFVLLVPQPVVPGFPETCVCGRGDCARIKEVIAQEEARVDREGQLVAARARVDARNRQMARREKGGKARGLCKPRAVAPVDGEACHRGMPPERDVVVGSSQNEFLSAVDVAPAHRRLLDYFQVHYGEYIALPVLEEVCGHHAVNSRCSELRELIPADHDIDQRSLFYATTGRLHSHYRLCKKAESHRLQRNKGAGDQGELVQ